MKGKDYQFKLVPVTHQAEQIQEQEALCVAQDNISHPQGKRNYLAIILLPYFSIYPHFAPVLTHYLHSIHSSQLRKLESCSLSLDLLIRSYFLMFIRMVPFLIWIARCCFNFPLKEMYLEFIQSYAVITHSKQEDHYGKT